MFEKCKYCIGNIVCHIGEDDELCRRFRARVEADFTDSNKTTMRCAECRWWDEERHALWNGARPCRNDSEYFVIGYTWPEFFCKNFERQTDNAKPKGERNGRNG